MRNKPLVLAALVLAACATQQQQPAPRESTRRYTVLMSTNTAGSQVVTTRGNEITVDYEYNDRGRGPKTHSVITVDERGLPLSIMTTGNDYMKQTIEESFSTEGGVARWKNSAEAGEGKAGAIYTSMYGSPEEAGIIAKPVLAAGGRMPIHGGGEITVKKVGEATIRGTHPRARGGRKALRRGG